MPAPLTALRATGERTAEGWTLLTDVESSYRDGAEAALHDLVMATDPASLGSADDTLLSHARGWAERYHVHPARANVVRPLALPAGARVLEIGAGCGAVTRYLGETVALVDALEPVPARARVARARTRDLDNVEVFVGMLEDVPDEPQYDVVVVVGVLEYVGGGSASDEAYRAFLEGIRRRLLPGGTLVLAIENKLGVKYLAGAPEDHSDRVFDSLESYPRTSPARTFDRRSLEALVRSAGMEPETRLAFPDYKITRAVLDPRVLAAHDASLLHRIPAFPSPDWGSPRPRLADERLLWRSLVEAGLSQETGNSFLLLARSPGAERGDLWPASSAAVFFSTGRRAELAARTTVVVDDDGLLFRRDHPSAAPVGPLTVSPSEDRHQRGVDLIDVVAAAPDPLAALAGLLPRWVALVDERVRDGEPVPVDLVPHNLLVREDGALVVVDEEWASTVATRRDVLGRGVLWLSINLTQRVAPERLEGLGTVRDVVLAVGALAGLGSDGAWLDDAVDREAVFQATVDQVVAGESEADSVERHRENMRVEIGRPLDSTLLGAREHELRQRAERARVDAADLIEVLRAEVLEQLGSAQAALARAEAAESVVRAEQAQLAWPLVRAAVSASRLLHRAARPLRSRLRRGGAGQ